MSKLTILGAQRVNALINILNEKENKEIAKLLQYRLPVEKAEELLQEQLGISEYIKEIQAIKKRIEELNKNIKSATGKTYALTTNYYATGQVNIYTKQLSDLQDNGVKEKVLALKDEYNRKKQMLWLCETLEEAKAIVGI